MIDFSLRRATPCAEPYFIDVFIYLFTCIVAEPLPFFSPPVQPGAEAHQDDPAGPSQTGDEGRLLHHIRDAVVALWARHYVCQLRTWGPCTRTHTSPGRNKEKQMAWPRFIYSISGWKCNDPEKSILFPRWLNAASNKGGKHGVISCTCWWIMWDFLGS